MIFLYLYLGFGFIYAIYLYIATVEEWYKIPINILFGPIVFVYLAVITALGWKVPR